ncbi:MAG: DUF3047 domain-containing protein [Candidatus Omnitrophota bacterium]|nr:MAG: DUF3047 domain-containing protein [Candidatus Omnitrophota bacterium]
MRNIRKISFNIFLLLLFFCIAAYSGVVCLKKFTFDDIKGLDKWKKMILSGEVKYSLIRHGKEGYVKALSEKSCSSLYYRIGFKLKDYSILKWKWKILQFPDISKARTEKERDDYAARVYVIFPFLTFSSSKFIEYIWAEDLPVGTIIDSPFGSNIKMIVVRKEMTPEGEWATETRNVYEDYIKVFGEKPRRNVGAIAIMCDADGTKTSAESLFDNIIIETQESFEVKKELE